MAYIGKKPTDVPLSSADIGDETIDSDAYVDGSIDNAHIADDAINSEHYADGSIDNAHIADDAIDSEHYADGSIDNAHIADDAINSEHYAAGSIDLEHMSSESVDEDNLHISNSGSNGNFLSKQSGDAGGLTWAAVSAGGGMTVLAHTTCSSTANVAFNSLFSGSYDSYVVYISDVAPVTSGSNLEIHVSSNAGSSYETANMWSLYAGQDGAGPSALEGGQNGAANAQIIIGTPINRSSGGAQMSGNCTVHIGDPVTYSSTYFHGTGCWRQTSPDGMGMWVWGGGWNGNMVMTGVKFEMSSGSIETGQFTLVGIKNAV